MTLRGMEPIDRDNEFKGHAIYVFQANCAHQIIYPA